MITVQSAQNVPFGNLVSCKFKKDFEKRLTMSIEIQTQSQQKPGYIPAPDRIINIELDVEKRLMAVVLKDRVRIKQFF